MTNTISNSTGSKPISTTLERVVVAILYAKGQVYFNDRVTHYGQACVKIIESISETGTIINTSREKLEKETGFSKDTVKKAVHFLVNEGYVSRYDVIGAAREDNLLKRNFKEYTLVCEDKLVSLLKANNIKFKFDENDLPIFHNDAIDIHNSIINSELSCGRKGVTEDKLLEKREVVKKPTKSNKYEKSIRMLVDANEKLKDFDSLISDNEFALIQSGNILGTKVVLDRILNDLNTYQELLAERVGPCKFRTELEDRITHAREAITNITSIVDNFKDDVAGGVLITIIDSIY